MRKGLLCIISLLFYPVQTGVAQGPGRLPDVRQSRVTLQSSPHRSISESIRAAQDRFDLIDIDTLFYIDNRGLTRILVNLNGHPFKLVVDPAEVYQSANAFLIPQFGEITINIAAYIRPGEGNFMEVASQGPDGSSADIIIGDLIVPGQEVAYAIEKLEELPATFGVLQSFPNPFSHRTMITYRIPEGRTSGVPATLTVYDVMGRRIRVLIDEPRYPGTFRVEWNGTGDQGQPVAGGVYFCQMVAGDFRQTIRLVYAR